MQPEHDLQERSQAHCTFGESFKIRTTWDWKLLYYLPGFEAAARGQKGPVDVDIAAASPVA